MYEAVITDVKGLVAYATIMGMGWCIAFAEKLASRILNGCDDRAWISP